MAPDAFHHRPGRVTRTFQWLFPSKRCLAITLAVEIGLMAVVGLLHLVLAEGA